MGIAQRIGLPFVQEVIACAAAVKSLIPETDTVVELGGEDAKITYFGDAPEQRMNGVCAGGTGSFIDHMASLLSTDATGLNALAERGKQIYTIASRCGVFAKTDIQALMNDGAEKADIALSIFQAVVNQTIGNLAQGRPISGHVAFLGGPLHFLPALRQRFIETLKLDDEHVVPVKDGNYFVALGAALSDETKQMDYASLSESIRKAGEEASTETRKADFVLFKNEDEYREFRERHDRDRVKRGDIASYEGPVYVGIDAGSTTTKIVVTGKDKEVLYTSYGSNEGSPLKTVVKELREMYHHINDKTYIAGALTTGYGEAIVKAAVHADDRRAACAGAGRHSQPSACFFGPVRSRVAAGNGLLLCRQLLCAGHRLSDGRIALPLQPPAGALAAGGFLYRGPDGAFCLAGAGQRDAALLENGLFSHDHFAVLVFYGLFRHVSFYPLFQPAAGGAEAAGTGTADPFDRAAQHADGGGRTGYFPSA